MSASPSNQLHVYADYTLPPALLGGSPVEPPLDVAVAADICWRSSTWSDTTRRNGSGGAIIAAPVVVAPAADSSGVLAVPLCLSAMDSVSAEWSAAEQTPLERGRKEQCRLSALQ